jgi:DNA-3-methyladenine glycosylase
MRQFRRNPERETNIASGPGKLCMAMQINKELNGADLMGRILTKEDRRINTGAIQTSPRVGVDYAGEYKDKPWRFFLADNPHVSRVRFK